MKTQLQAVLTKGIHSSSNPFAVIGPRQQRDSELKPPGLWGCRWFLCRTTALQERHFVIRVIPRAIRVDDGGRDEDHKILLRLAGRLALEEPAHERQIAQQRHLILDFGDIVGD